MDMDTRTVGQRVSDAVAKFGGSWKFILIAASILIGWVILNLNFETCRFDPYPFILLNLFLSLIAAFQAPFIMMSQHRAEAKQDAAYRALFREIKELIESNIEIENKIHDAVQEIKDKN